MILVGLALSGCASQQRYEWNQYDQHLYDFYKNPATSEDFIKTMEAHVRNLEAAGKKPGPGLYAEVGTFYLSKGDTKTAVQYYNKEMLAWPESKSLMTAMIANIDKPKPEEKK